MYGGDFIYQYFPPLPNLTQRYFWRGERGFFLLVRFVFWFFLWLFFFAYNGVPESTECLDSQSPRAAASGSVTLSLPPPPPGPSPRLVWFTSECPPSRCYKIGEPRWVFFPPQKCWFPRHLFFSVALRRFIIIFTPSDYSGTFLIVVFYLFSHYEFKLTRSVSATQDVRENKQDVGDQFCPKYQISFPPNVELFLFLPRLNQEFGWSVTGGGRGCVDIFEQHPPKPPSQKCAFPGHLFGPKVGTPGGGYLYLGSICSFVHVL